MPAKLAPGRQRGTLVQLRGTARPEDDAVEWTGDHSSVARPRTRLTRVDAP